MSYKLNWVQYQLLLEALRRFTMRDRNKTLRYEWTGLGTYAVYRPVIEADLMESIDAPKLCKARRLDQWWRLTDKGAAIVQLWLDAGYGAEHFHNFDFNFRPAPPQKLAEGETIPPVAKAKTA